MLLVATLFTACNQNEDDTPGIGNPPSNVDFTYSIKENVVLFVASATDAYQYYWTFGDKNFGTGDSASHAYEDPGEYTISLTAIGKGGQTSISKKVTLDKGNPTKFSTYNILLSGYNPITKTSSKVWIWDKTAGGFSCGPPANGSYFDPIDDSWWRAGENEMANYGCYDDEFSFLLETSEYKHKSGESFLYNWAWANELRGQTQNQYADTALPYTPPAATWKIKNYINGTDTARVIELTNGAWIGIGNGTHAYHIVSISSDTLWIRYDASTPDVFSPTKTMSEWGYLRLVTKKE